MTKFKPSPYQQKFLTWVRDGKGSAVVVAVAGSGKTTTIIQGLAQIPEGRSVRMLAFNTTIASELKAKIAELGEELGRSFKDVSASTFHSLGYGVLGKRLGLTRADQPDANKLRNICRDWLGEDDRTLYSDFICKLVSLAKGQGVGCLVPDTDAIWWEMIQHHDLFLEAEDATEGRAVELARQLLAHSNRLATERKLIDFDDMLYLPLVFKLRLWQNDWVFIDEAQDTNPVRRALAKLALKPGGRLVAVGDPRQAIYGFTGASHDAIDLIKSEFNCVELPLTVSYRCGRSIVALAQNIVPYIEAFDGAAEGLVEHDKTMKEALAVLGDHDAILCRNTAPLVTQAYQIIAQGRAVRILGREIGQGLVSLVKNMKAKNLPGLEDKLAAYAEREAAKFMAKGQEGKAEAVHDRVECLRVVIGNLPENERTIPGLIRRIESLFSDSNGCLTLCTVHKAKGKEWDRVAILRPDLMPSKWARQDWQQLQEDNLMYVAWTRAKAHLIFLAKE